jgi:DNA polymerase epsilon subunit 2
MPTTVRSSSPPSLPLPPNPFISQLILADAFDPYKLVYERCLVFNPGSFHRRKFTWGTYHPHMSEIKERMEESELPGPDDY